MKVPVLEYLLDLRNSSIPASGRTLAKLMMNFRSLSLLAILILLIVPVECFTGKFFFWTERGDIFKIVLFYDILRDFCASLITMMTIFQSKNKTQFVECHSYSDIFVSFFLYLGKSCK